MNPQNFEKKGGKNITRRDFIGAGGAVIASALLFNSLSSCSTSKTNTTATTPAAATITKSPSGTTSTLNPKYGGTLRVSLSSTAPAVIGWPPEGLSGAATYTQYCVETLLFLDDKGNLNPGLAESYKLADDLMSVTLYLRKGVKFHDGSDFNAQVAKWNLDNMINAKLEPYWASVDIIDDYTIRVNFTKWVVTLLMYFGDYPNVWPGIVSKAAFEKNGLDWMRRNPVGTGPFKFDSFNQDVSFIVVRNPDYWQKGKPYLDKIEVEMMPDRTTREMALKVGAADVGDIAVADASDFSKLGFNVTTSILGINILIPDTANSDSPWANQKVREAVEYAIDREGIAKGLGYGYWQAPYQIPPHTTLIYDPNFPLARKHDTEKAKQLLAEAGFANGFETTIIVSPMEVRDVATAMQANLNDVGIKINLDFPDFGKFVNYMNPMGAWHNAAILSSMPAGNAYCLGGLPFILNVIGKSWLRTPDLTEAWQAVLNAPAPDAKLVRTVTDMMTNDALLIPVYEPVTASVQIPELVRYIPKFDAHQDYEDYWLNK